MAHGHPEARHYPVPMLWQETKIVKQRVNRDHATQALLTRMAVSSVLSEKADKAFQKHIRDLTET